MEIVFHTGKESDKAMKEFIEKRTEFLVCELRKLSVQELKNLLYILREDNRTFEKE